MAFIKEGIFTVRSRIEDLDESGLATDAENIESTCEGFLRAGEGEMLLTYTEGEGEAKTFSQITVFSDSVIVTRRGATESSIRLKMGEKHTSVYKIPPYAFDMEVEALRIRNEMSIKGGRLDLHYFMTVGGQKRKVRLSLSFAPSSLLKS
ncbi:MAG: DUF1934 domain-containing protein [Clostridia bacterium]|nr:DUF1934 domain-containing protein [Clostridia bacterium]